MVSKRTVDREADSQLLTDFQLALTAYRDQILKVIASTKLDRQSDSLLTIRSLGSMILNAQVTLNARWHVALRIEERSSTKDVSQLRAACVTAIGDALTAISMAKGEQVCGGFDPALEASVIRAARRLKRHLKSKT